MSAAGSQGTPSAPPSEATTSAGWVQARREARWAARASVEASRGALDLHGDVQSTMHSTLLNDLKKPCAPISPSAVHAEAVRTVSADHVQPSHWCHAATGPDANVPPACGGADSQPVAFEDQLHVANLVVGPAENDTATTELRESLQLGLRRLFYEGRPLTFADAKQFAEVLGADGCTVDYVAFNHGAIDINTVPPTPPELLDAEVARITAQVGPEDEEDPASTEALQALCEKAKVEFTSYEASAKALAALAFDRIPVVMTALRLSKTVTHLDLSRNNLGAPNAEGRAQYQTLRRIGVLLDETKSLRSVDLSGNRMGPQGVGIIAKAMTKNITIHTLNLSGNELMVEAPDEDEDPENEEGDPVFGELYQALEALSELIKKNKFLRVLSLRQNNLKAEIDVDGDDDGADTPLGHFLEPFRKYHRLEVLDISCNDLGAAGARMVATFLKNNTSLRVLDVSDNELGLRGLDYMASLLSENTTLTTLHMQRNGISYKAKSKKATKQAFATFDKFSEALRTNPTLTELSLGGHQFGVEVSAALLAGLPESSITNLSYESNSLCGTPETDVPDTRALDLIAQACRRTEGRPSMKVLRLASNRLLAAGARVLAEGAQLGVEGTALEELDISRNVIGDEGLDSIAETLLEAAGVGVSSLRTLRVGYNAIRDASKLLAAITSGKLPVLRSLDLSSNRLGAETQSFVAFLGAVGSARGLRTLRLRANGIGQEPEQTEALVQYFKDRGFGADTLCTIDLFDNPQLTLADTQRLLTALKSSNGAATGQGIHRLLISSQAGDRIPLSDTVAEMLSTNTALVDVDLCFPRAMADDEVATKIARTLHLNALRCAASGISTS